MSVCFRYGMGMIFYRQEKLELAAYHLRYSLSHSFVDRVDGHDSIA